MGNGITWQVWGNKSTGGTGSIPANGSNIVCTSPGVKNLIIYEEEEVVGTRMRVYPDPSSGKVFLEFSEQKAATTTLEVYNAVGMKCSVPVVRTADRLMEVDLSSLGAGT